MHDPVPFAVLVMRADVLVEHSIRASRVIC